MKMQKCANSNVKMVASGSEFVGETIRPIRNTVESTGDILTETEICLNMILVMLRGPEPECGQNKEICCLSDAVEALEYKAAAIRSKVREVASVLGVYLD